MADKVTMRIWRSTHKRLTKWKGVLISRRGCHVEFSEAIEALLDLAGVEKE